MTGQQPSSVSSNGQFSFPRDLWAFEMLAGAECLTRFLSSSLWLGGLLTIVLFRITLWLRALFRWPWEEAVQDSLGPLAGSLEICEDAAKVCLVANDSPLSLTGQTGCGDWVKAGIVVACASSKSLPSSLFVLCMLSILLTLFTPLSMCSEDCPGLWTLAASKCWLPQFAPWSTNSAVPAILGDIWAWGTFVESFMWLSCSSGIAAKIAVSQLLSIILRQHNAAGEICCYCSQKKTRRQLAHDLVHLAKIFQIYRAHFQALDFSFGFASDSDDRVTGNLLSTGLVFQAMLWMQRWREQGPVDNVQ